MVERRSSVDRFLKKFSETLGFGLNDLVSYAPTGHKVIGIVVDIDPKIRKIYVDWGGCGNIHQHDPEELQITMLQEKAVKNKMASVKIKKITAAMVGDISTTDFIDPVTSDLLNKQFAAELSNSAFYRCCASWFGNNGYPGFEAYFLRQGDGEAEHAMKVYTFLAEAGIRVVFPVINDQQIATDLKSIIKQTLVKETETTKNWQIISKSAETGNNVAVTELCQWFMKEQMEEESSITTLYQKVMNLPLSGGLETIDMLLREKDPIVK